MVVVTKGAVSEVTGEEMSELVASAEDNTLTALVVHGADCDERTVRKVEGRQGVSAQERTVRAFVVGDGKFVLVLGGFDRAAAEHSLDPGGQL